MRKPARPGGVNWYLRNKIDTAGGTPAYALAMDRGLLVGTMENHFEQTDFSGSFGTAAIAINDPMGNAITVFSGSVISGTTILTGQLWSSFVGIELGGNITISTGTASVVGSKGITAVTATGASCAGNIGITC